MATSSARRKREVGLDELALALDARDDGALLVFALPEVFRLAWANGLERANALYEAGRESLHCACDLVLRRVDLIACDRDAAAFAIALLSPARQHATVSIVDFGRVLGRIEWVLLAQSDLRFETGFATAQQVRDSGSIRTAVQLAVDRGRRERERLEFLSGFAHEIRTPISSIVGSLAGLMESSDDERRKRLIEMAHDEALRVERLVSALFEISWQDLDASHRAQRRTNAHEALERAASAMGAAAWRRRTLISVIPCDGVEIPLGRDQAVLLFSNLFENAIKHGKHQGSIRASIERTERDVTIHIDDDGPGIPEADRERIFLLLQRGRSSNGTGIGLALMRGLVERSGGTLVVTESPLGGSRFVVRLPAATLGTRVELRVAEEATKASEAVESMLDVLW